MTTESLVSIIASIVSTGCIGYIFRSAVRLEVLESLFAEKKTTIDTVKLNQESMDRRLILVETVITGLNDVLPELRKLGMLADRLDIMISANKANIERLQDAVFHEGSK